MKIKLILPLMSLLVIACDSTSQSGNTAKNLINSEAQERGNGSDYITSEGHAAWFSGQGKVFSYCVKTAPAFGMTEQDAKLVIDEAITMWRDYARERAPDSQVVFTGRLESHCSQNTDLVFDLGSKQANTTKDVQHLGLAIRKNIDAKTKWSKGTIWIAAQGSIELDEIDSTVTKTFPDWSEKNALRAVVLHELGHVFGVEHIELTVMDEKLAHRLAWTLESPFSPFKEYRDKFLSGIDGYQAVLSPKVQVGSLGLPADKRFKDACAGNEVDNFELLTGRKPVGKITASLQATDYRQYTLKISDSQESLDFVLDVTNLDLPSHGFVSLKNVFFEFRSENGLSWYDGKYRGAGTHSLMLQTKRGETVYLSLLENLQSGFSVLADDKYRGYVATGRVLVMHRNQGPQYLFMSSLFLDWLADDLPNPRDRVRSCR